MTSSDKDKGTISPHKVFKVEKLKIDKEIAGHKATPLSDRRRLIIGGRDDADLLSVIFIYGPLTGERDLFFTKICQNAPTFGRGASL